MSNVKPATRTLAQALARFVRNTKDHESERFELAAHLMESYRVNPLEFTFALFELDNPGESLFADNGPAPVKSWDIAPAIGH